MRPVLGIELGPTRCALVLVDDRRDRRDRRASRAVPRVVAQHVIAYTDTLRLAEELRRVRVAHRLPRRARVVVWPAPGDAGVTSADSAGSSEGFTPGVWRLRERLRPLVRAGFRVSGALAPAQAAASVAAFVEGPSPVAVLVIDERAGSIAVARQGRLLASREMVWTLGAPAGDAPLVDRYAFAAQVLPHLRRMMAPRGARVEKVLLCGPAPAIRALAAPLIEELDVEVEALDGAGGVTCDAEPDASASAQLAAAAALSGAHVNVIPGIGKRPALTPIRVMIGAAAAAAVIVLVLLFWPAPQASRSRRATTGVEGVGEAGPLPGHRSALRGQTDASLAFGEMSCARRSASA